MKARSRIKKQTKRGSRNAKGQYTVMSFKDRMVVINMLLLTLIGSYILHYRSGYTSDISEVVVEARGEELVIPTEVQPERIQVLPEPVEAPELSQKEQIIAYILETFGNDAQKMIWIAECESTFDPSRIGDKDLMLYDSTHDEMVGDSVGLFQIRTGGKGWNRARANGMTADEFRTYLLDWKNNIDYAKTILDRSGFTPWTCARRSVI